VGNEAFTRVVIDKALEASGWNLLDHLEVEFEFNTASGRADYLLRDGLGRVLCVLEAKREDLDPYDAKEQARGYAPRRTGTPHPPSQARYATPEVTSQWFTCTTHGIS